jgi:hypothetical protein
MSLEDGMWNERSEDLAEEELQSGSSIISTPQGFHLSSG